MSSGSLPTPTPPIPVVECYMAHTVRTGHYCGSQSLGPGEEPFGIDEAWMLPTRRGVSRAVREALREN